MAHLTKSLKGQEQHVPHARQIGLTISILHSLPPRGLEVHESEANIFPCPGDVGLGHMIFFQPMEFGQK